MYGIFTNIYHSMRANAWFTIGAFSVAFIAGVFPDAISHGIILPGREGHQFLATVGAGFVAIYPLWHGLNWALYRRYGTVTQRSLDVVE